MTTPEPARNDRIDQLRSLLESDPNDAFCLYGLAMEHARAGEPATAVEYFDQAIASDPDYLYAYYHKARCLLDADDPKAARDAADAGLRRARSAGDHHAAGELEALLDEIT